MFLSFAAVLGSCKADVELSEVLHDRSSYFQVDPKLIDEYASIREPEAEDETILFFTDPHLLNKGDMNIYSRFDRYITTISRYSQALPDAGIICGGDWIGKNDTRDEAKYKLSYVDSVTFSLFGSRYFPIVGNHDTNYQGRSDAGEPYGGELRTEEYTAAYMSHIGSSYYFMKATNTLFYVLDSYKEIPVITDYRRKQEIWLAEHLLNDDSPHSAVCMHIFYIDAAGTLSPFAEDISQIIVAYNRREKIVLGEHNYDFGQCSGRVQFVLSGHTHKDCSSLLVDGTPCLSTAELKSDSRPTFDLIYINYSQASMSLLRIGCGGCREFNLK